MSPAVEAAIIAGSVGILTLIGTLAAQFYGIRRTSNDTGKALEEQGKQLDRTLAEQREQLDRTLAEQRTRTLNERFATAASQLGSDKPPAVRLAGVYAMAGLADDWEENRQTCVDVLCAYLRMPYEPDPGEGASQPERLAFQASREVRHTVIRVITEHLKDGAAVSWQGRNFDFTGTGFDGGSFSGAVFSGGRVSFLGAKFSGGTVDFRFAVFSGGTVDFRDAEFSGGTVDGFRAVFSGSTVDFRGAKFLGSTVDFGLAVFSGGTVDFHGAEFSGGEIGFGFARFCGSKVSFGGDSDISTHTYEFEVGTRPASVLVSHDSYGPAEFSGGTVDFGFAADWSVPPTFPWTDFAETPPSGVTLPGDEPVAY